MLSVRLEPVSRERVAPGDAAVVATFVNAGEQAELFNDHLAQHGSLVLQVEDESGRALLLPPPAPPDERDLAPGRPLAPGESITIRYGGFLDAYAESGRYRVRYFANHPRLGGSPLVPLMSGWVLVDVVQPSFVPAVRRPPWLDFARDPPGAIRRLLDYIWLTILRLNCRAVLEEEVDVEMSQAITYVGAPEYDKYYWWHARFHVQVNQPQKQTYVTIRLRLNTGNADPVPWVTAIKAAWDNRFKSCVDLRCSPNGYPIRLAIAWVPHGEHHVVTVTSYTTSMTDWALGETLQVKHEVGHMLGNKDEYATVDGVYYGGAQPDGNIMNNLENPPAAANYKLIQQTVERLLSVKSSLRGKPAKPVNQPCA